MKFDIRQYRAFQSVMKPLTPAEAEKTTLFAQMFAEFVLPHYMSDTWEFAGYNRKGEAEFFNTETGDYATASELWSTCQFVEECAANGGTLPDPDNYYTPDDWCVDDEDILI